MKATELMQGDLIYEGDNIVIKVECLCYHEINGMMEECYSPIPLTAEILKKNDAFTHGFAEYSLGGIHIKAQYDYDDVFQNSFIVKDILIEYVHELQRVLRCCGLWDLANNFKI